MSEVAVIGAGLAGLVAARELQERGLSVVVFDKGRGPGGRISTRRADPFRFDHGAQYFTARDPGFRRRVDDWIERGVAARWDGTIVALEPGHGPEPVSGGVDRFVGVPGMNAIAKDLALSLDVRCGVRVAPLVRRDERWHLRSDDDRELGSFDQIVITAPPEQAAELIGETSPLAESARRIRMQPCWAVLVGLDSSVPVPFDGAFCNESSLSWIARDSSKPGRPAGEAWVLHASPSWTAAHVDMDRATVADELCAEFSKLTGVVFEDVVHVAAHRWLYSRPEPQAPEVSTWDEVRRLALAGDGTSGGRVEGAVLSGERAAARIAGRS